MANILDGLDLAGQRAANAADPTSAQDLATRAYVDAHAGAAARATATATTASLAPGAADAATTITLGKGYLLYSIQTSRPARVELYTTTAARDADATRPFGADPVATAGVVLDYLTPAGGVTYSLGPVVAGASEETVPAVNIAMRVTNADTATGTVTVTLLWLKVE